MKYTADNFVRDLAEPYAWPGGYPRYFITADGGALSYAAAETERRLIRRAIRTNDARGGWCVVACDVNWEDPDLICDHTGARIESAYERDKRMKLHPTHAQAATLAAQLQRDDPEWQYRVVRAPTARIAYVVEVRDERGIHLGYL